MKIDPILKEKWISALRSGQYKQGRGRLRNEDDHYCCLGVLCEVMGIPWEPSEETGDMSYAGSIAYVPGQYAQQIGITPGGLFDKEITMSDLDDQTFSGVAALNDAGYSFAVIANVIEKQF